MTDTPSTVEDWEGRKRILVFLAHPDDPEFFCGGSIARWIALGHEIHYALFTTGQRGNHNPDKNEEEIGEIRKTEQRNAARVLGIKSVAFLGYLDGDLIPTLDMRREVVRIIRTVRPDVIVTCDPQNLFSGNNRINHPDHRAAGQAVVDAAFPASGSPAFYSEMLKEEGLFPHTPSEIWMSLTNQPNVVLDVTEYIEKKLLALHEHRSQVGNLDEFDLRMRSRWRVNDAFPPRYEERFLRVKLG